MRGKATYEPLEMIRRYLGRWFWLFSSFLVASLLSSSLPSSLLSPLSLLFVPFLCSLNEATILKEGLKPA